MRWHFAGRQLPAVGFPRKIVLAPLICDLGIIQLLRSMGQCVVSGLALSVAIDHAIAVQYGIFSVG